mmetsp:Transcript_2514/g.8042  ORF Transcript_2514/g.8042 Transcript_2514/m.8042 type:complete len:308 (+) Transcript_2514:1600-2523(+)
MPRSTSACTEGPTPPRATFTRASRTSCVATWQHTDQTRKSTSPGTPSAGPSRPSSPCSSCCGTSRRGRACETCGRSGRRTSCAAATRCSRGWGSRGRSCGASRWGKTSSLGRSAATTRSGRGRCWSPPPARSRCRSGSSRAFSRRRCSTRRWATCSSCRRCTAARTRSYPPAPGYTRSPGRGCTRCSRTASPARGPSARATRRRGWTGSRAAGSSARGSGGATARRRRAAATRAAARPTTTTATDRGAPGESSPRPSCSRRGRASRGIATTDARTPRTPRKNQRSRAKEGRSAAAPRGSTTAPTRDS